MVEDRHFAPFGEIAAAAGGITPVETIGFIGERYDADAGLPLRPPHLAKSSHPDY